MPRCFIPYPLFLLTYPVKRGDGARVLASGHSQGKNVAVNPDDASIAAAIIGLRRSLNLKTIAEGVEDEAQMSFLRAHQCDEIQGYYFSKPLTVDEVVHKLPSAKAHNALSASNSM